MPAIARRRGCKRHARNEAIVRRQIDGEGHLEEFASIRLRARSVNASGVHRRVKPQHERRVARDCGNGREERRDRAFGNLLGIALVEIAVPERIFPERNRRTEHEAQKARTTTAVGHGRGRVPRIAARAPYARRRERDVACRTIARRIPFVLPARRGKLVQRQRECHRRLVQAVKRYLPFVICGARGKNRSHSYNSGYNKSGDHMCGILLFLHRSFLSSG